MKGHSLSRRAACRLGVAFVTLATLATLPTAATAGVELGDAPVLPATELALPDRELSASVHPNDGFTGSISLAAEALVLYELGGEHDGIVYRPCATLRLGPLVVCGGAVITDAGTAYNAHLELVSYQRSGWEFAVGAGLHDAATVRIAVPLTARWLPLRTRVARLRAMYSFVGAHRFGAGLELDVW